MNTDTESRAYNLATKIGRQFMLQSLLDELPEPRDGGVSDYDIALFDMRRSIERTHRLERNVTSDSVDRLMLIEALQQDSAAAAYRKTGDKWYLQFIDQSPEQRAEKKRLSKLVGLVIAADINTTADDRYESYAERTTG